MSQPTSAADRIQTLDVLRGFALLGILLLNILGFGLASSAYSNPGFDVSVGLNADFVTWATVELFAEGAMRCLFSILFGAGVVLFLGGERGKSGSLHYRRTFWLFAFGLLDAYVLLWNGDILVTYAICGALLYLLRNWSPRNLLIAAAVLLVLASGFHGLVSQGLQMSKNAWLEVQAVEDPSTLHPGTLEMARGWEDFEKDFAPPAEKIEAELRDRRTSYHSAFLWNLEKTNTMLMMVLPMFLFWDALMMMLVGMALFKLGALQGTRSNSFYVKMMFGGFAVGLLVNSFEVSRAAANNLELFSVFAQMQPTYHLGRLGMALGYLALLCLICKSGIWHPLQLRLAAVGRMALTNYLMHSLICAVLFTGLGFGLVGEMSRAMLYPVVLGIWLLQLWLSPWWLARFAFGPLEWLWRALTYGQLPAMKR